MTATWKPTDLLESPVVYRTHMRLLGGRMIKRKLLERFLPTTPGLRVLDIGCGPAPDRDLMGEVEWTGLELNEKYVRYVERRLRRNDRILLGDVAKVPEFLGEVFDVVLLSGVLHHLTDEQAQGVLENCSPLLDHDGFVLTIDPVRTTGASRLERLLLDADRGNYIRDKTGYDRLVPSSLGRVESSVHHGLGWLPQAQRVSVLRR